MPEKELVAELCARKHCFSCGRRSPRHCRCGRARFKERPDKDLIDIDVDIYCERKEP